MTDEHDDDDWLLDECPDCEGEGCDDEGYACWRCNGEGVI